MAFPDRLHDVKRLVDQHSQLKHQKLLLAIYFDRPQAPESVHLLEVISQLGYDEVSGDRELFEMSYGSTEGFGIPVGSRLSIILTNAIELRIAIKEEWDALKPVLAAVEAGQEHYRVVYKSGEGNNLAALLRREAVMA